MGKQVFGQKGGSDELPEKTVHWTTIGGVSMKMKELGLFEIYVTAFPLSRAFTRQAT